MIGQSIYVTQLMVDKLTVGAESYLEAEVFPAEVELFLGVVCWPLGVGCWLLPLGGGAWLFLVLLMRERSCK